MSNRMKLRFCVVCWALAMLAACGGSSSSPPAPEPPSSNWEAASWDQFNWA